MTNKSQVKNLIIIRPMRFEDIPQLAIVHVKTWQATYRGIMSDQFLNQLDLRNFEKRWRERFKEDGPSVVTFVALIGDEIVGFAVGDKPRIEISDCDCELYAINILPKAQKQGLGKKLMKAVVLNFANQGFQSMFLQVAEKNTNARQFYSHLGAQEMGELGEEESSHGIREIVCVWDDLEELIKKLT